MEFRRDTVELVLMGGKSVTEAARNLGIYDPALSNWVKQAVSTGISIFQRRAGRLSLRTVAI